MGNCVRPASSLQVQPIESLQSVAGTLTTLGDNASECMHHNKQSNGSDQGSNAGAVDAIVILSKFNITNMRILVKAMGNSWVKLHKIVECMIKTCRASDYFYLDEYSDEQLRSSLTEFFKLYLPTKMQEQNDVVYISGYGLMAAAFHTCWAVNDHERHEILYEMCSGADGTVYKSQKQIAILISCLITFCSFSVDQYQYRANCGCVVFFDFKKKTRKITSEVVEALF